MLPLASGDEYSIRRCTETLGESSGVRILYGSDDLGEIVRNTSIKHVFKDKSRFNHEVCYFRPAQEIQMKGLTDEFHDPLTLRLKILFGPHEFRMHTGKHKHPFWFENSMCLPKCLLLSFGRKIV